MYGVHTTYTVREDVVCVSLTGEGREWTSETEWKVPIESAREEVLRKGGTPRILGATLETGLRPEATAS